jgi:hypothetical protein
METHPSFTLLTLKEALEMLEVEVGTPIVIYDEYDKLYRWLQP